MYLKRLVEFAEEHEEIFPPLGFKRKKYQWIVDVVDYKLYFLKAARGDMRVLPDIARSSGIKSILLSDRADYVFGFSEKGANETRKDRAKKRHEAYLSLLKGCIKETQNNLVVQVYNLLQKPIDKFPENVKEDDYFVFRVEGKFVHEQEDIKLFWKNHLTPTVDGSEKMQCMVCGELSPVLERHSISFHLGRERTKLISANENAYESHNLKASKGAPTCYACEQKYGQTLQYLLQRHTDTKEPGGPHMFRVGDITYVYWLRMKEQIAQLNGIINPSTRNPHEIKHLIQSIFSGIKTRGSINDFCILTISANKARMVVRGYEENSLKNVQRNIEHFFEAQDINQSRFYGIYTLAATMYKNPSVQMEKYAVDEWVNWFFTGNRLSSRVLIPLLKEIQAGGVMYANHAAALKSWLVSQNEEEWTVTVNKEDTRASYLCGRLFAVLEKVQQDATTSNETIASRYFGSASTTPQAIFGLLIKNSQAHLNSIRKEMRGKEINYSKRIEEILAKLNDFPAVLDLKKQAEFALGYYQERQDLYTKQDKKGVMKNES